MTDQPAKFCKDCKHAHEVDINILKSVWGCKLLGRIDPVDGRQIYRKCAVERAATDGKCGPEGNLYEPRSAA